MVEQMSYVRDIYNQYFAIKLLAVGQPQRSFRPKVGHKLGIDNEHTIRPKEPRVKINSNYKFIQRNYPFKQSMSQLVYCNL